MVISSPAQRHTWVDTAKGMGILLVLTGHLPLLPHALLQLIHAVNMPCFFFVSGLLFKAKAPFLTFLHQKWLRLLKPYLYFSGISYAIWLGLRPFSHTLSKAPVLNTAVSIVYGSNMPNCYMAHNMPLWFLPCLFVASLLFYGFSRLPARWHAAFALMGAGLSLFLSLYRQTGRLPFSADVALMAAAFMSLGYLNRDYLLKAAVWRWPLLFALIAFTVVLAFANSFVDVNYNQYGNPVLFFGAALCGIAFIMNAAKKLSAFPSVVVVLSRIAKNSLYILGFHYVGFILITSLLSGIDRVLHSHISLVNQIEGPLTLFNVVTMLIYLGFGLWFSRQAKHLMCFHINQSFSAS